MLDEQKKIIFYSGGPYPPVRLRGGPYAPLRLCARMHTLLDERALQRERLPVRHAPEPPDL